MAEDSAGDDKIFNFQGDDSGQGANPQGQDPQGTNPQAQNQQTQSQGQSGTQQDDGQSIDPAYNYQMGGNAQDQGSSFTINTDGTDAPSQPVQPAPMPASPQPQATQANPVTPPPAPQPQSTPPTPPADPMGGFNPGAAGMANPVVGTPTGTTGAAGTGTPPPPPIPKDDGDPANFNIAKYIPQNVNVKVPAHSLQFDEKYFLELLAGSISLTRDEKKRIIDSIPKLRQEQVDELIRIFEEERRKFAELSDKHVPQLEKLAKQHALDWESLQSQEVEEEKASEDQAKMDDIKKNLGLN